MSGKQNPKAPGFNVGPDAKRELKRVLLKAGETGGAEETIRTFQKDHSLHTMMARAFGTTPRHKADEGTQNVESLDTDSAMSFLSHLGLTHFEVHKRISDTLLKQLEGEIRKTKAQQPLLDLLSSCWGPATTVRELRPVVWAVLKQLGERTPLAALKALAERDRTGKLKHSDVFRELPPLLKRLCWEADWDSRIPAEPEPKNFLQLAKSTLLYETLIPHVEDYCQNPLLVQAANQMFTETRRERRMLTKQRRALTAAATATSTSTTTTSSLLRGSAVKHSSHSNSLLNSGESVRQLRNLLSDSVGTALSYRPKLLYALLTVLMGQHGALSTLTSGGSQHLHCTLVADLLLSAGGALPKAYQHVLNLARVCDDCVQEGLVSDEALLQIQKAVKLVFQPDMQEEEEQVNKKQAAQKEKEEKGEEEDVASSNSTKRQLNRIITAGLNAMKEADPQNLFLNPVTDAIAPGYSKVIRQPMSIVEMGEKVRKSQYSTIGAWEADVKLMFKNCVDYNSGSSGSWFRGQAKAQGNVFKDEILPQAKRLFHEEIVKRKEREVIKRKAEEIDVGGVKPLPPSSKKRKKEKEDFLPSMPALASMLLSDPFVVRVLVARVLSDLRRSVLAGKSLPVVHNAIPAVLQLLHLSCWSPQLCAIRGKRFFVPDGGVDKKPGEDPALRIPFLSLRQFIPLLLRLLLEADMDKRISQGGDLYQAAQSTEQKPKEVSQDSWNREDDNVPVVLLLVQGAIIQVSRPGAGNDASLAVTFPRFSAALRGLSSTSLWHQRAFFQCLVATIVKHKSKLSKPSRDAIVASWLEWLKPGTGKEDRKQKEGSITSAAHEYLITLLNDWSALGNLLLPRDKLVEFATSTVNAANASENDNRKFGRLWVETNDEDFDPIRRQYERMLKHLPDSQAEEWKEAVGIKAVPVDDKEEEEEEESNEVNQAGEVVEDVEMKESEQSPLAG